MPAVESSPYYSFNLVARVGRRWGSFVRRASQGRLYSDNYCVGLLGAWDCISVYSRHPLVTGMVRGSSYDA